jgi:hypothetical protein
MQRIFAGASFAIAIAVLGGNAAAVPIQFNFQGINTGSTLMPEGSVQGQTISGGFSFETDLLVRRNLVPAEFGAVFEGEAQGFLSFGDRTVSYPVYGTYNYGSILFYDGCRSLDCPSDEDEFNLELFSAEQSPETLASGFTGTYRASLLRFSSAKDFLSPSDLFDGATVNPTAIVDLPISAVPSGVYIELLYQCESGQCTGGQVPGFGFEVTSVTRSTGTYTSVPEPGSLGLLGAAGLGLLLLGRRRVARIS